MLKAFVCRKAGGPGHSGVEHTCVLALSCESRTVGVKEFEFLKPFFAIVPHGFTIKLLRVLLYIR